MSWLYCNLDFAVCYSPGHQHVDSLAAVPKEPFVLRCLNGVVE